MILENFYHGSPYAFDHFDISKVGTGDSRSKFGWGLYFTDSPNTALKYAKELSIGKLRDTGFNIYEVKLLGLDYFYEWDSEITEDIVQSVYNALNKTGHEDSAEQFQTEIQDYGLWTMDSLYQYLEAILGGKKEASEFLYKFCHVNGVIGQTAWLEGNVYVAFSDEIVKIINHTKSDEMNPLDEVRKIVRKIVREFFENKSINEEVLEEDYNSIKEIKELANDVLVYLAKINLDSFLRQVNSNSYIDYLMPVRLLEVYQENPKKFSTLSDFLINTKIYVKVSRTVRDSGVLGHYTHIKEPEYDKEKYREIVLFPGTDFYNRLTSDYSKEKAHDYRDAYFTMWYAFHSTLEHEIQHAYDDYRSNSKLFQARKSQEYVKKHTMANGRSAVYANPELNKRKHQEYLKLQHEIWARFTQAVNETRFTKGDFATSPDGIQYFHYTMKPLAEVVKDFTIHFDGWRIMPDSVKKKLAARVSAYWHKEMENLDAKNQKSIEREKEALSRVQVDEIRKFVRDILSGNEINSFLNLKEVYEADVAIETVLYNALGNYFLDNRDEILDNVYSTLSSRTANWAVDQLIEDYPDLEKYRLEFIEAAVKEGYFEMTADKWNKGELEEDTQNDLLKDYKKWKKNNVMLRGISSEGTLDTENGSGARFGNGLYMAPLSNKAMAKQYGKVYFVVNGKPKNPMVFRDTNLAEIWIQQNLIFNNYKNSREFEANTSISKEMLKRGYDGIEIKGRETVNFAPENVMYFATENGLIDYYERNIENQPIEENLNEDYPSSFDLEYFKSLKTFKERLKYCNQNLKRLGSGSSRAVYQIDDNKVLKLAMNKKGIAQNDTEIDRGSGDYFSSILAHVFDSHPDGLWVEMELAIPINKYEFRRLTEFDISDVGKYLINFQDENNGKRTKYHLEQSLVDRLDNDEFVQQLREFVAGTDALAGDLGVATSYGIVRRNNHDELVLIDFGITTEIYKDFYAESIMNEDSGRELGKSLANQISTPFITIYRAAPMGANEFFDKDYVTLSKKFAIEHAENNHVYHDEPYHVIQALVSTKDVYDAYNPGEYFYSGPNKKAREIYVSLGPDEYEGLEESKKKINNCPVINLTEEAVNEIKKYKSSEDLLRAGGLSSNVLDRAAFGFSSEDIKELMPKQLYIKWKEDWKNVKWEQEKSGLTKKEYVSRISLEEPIDVSFSKGKFFVEDGHHRLYAASVLKKPLKVKLEIRDNPVLKLAPELSYDDFHRCIFNQVNKK